MGTQCFPHKNMSSYLIIKKASFNHKNLTPNQHNDPFWVENEFIVHNLHLRIGFCKIWQKSLVTTVKNHEKYGKINLKLLTSSER